MVSIIIVHYRVKRELFACIESILSSEPKIRYEIIVVDNDEKKTIQADLKKKFPGIIYVPNDNKGLGQGNNIGAKHAKGEFFFFLNPDTKVYKNCIDSIIKYSGNHKDVGIVAPVLYHINHKLFELQGLGKLTPFTAIFALSFLNKIFPRNSISKKYWNLDWDKKTVEEVQAVPGTAFVIKKELFERIGGFDENFFLYFEETDLCKRVSELGLKLIMYPPSKVYHAWGKSTEKSSKNISHIFKKSRFYYFKKHFGLLQAFFAEAILRINKYNAGLAIIIAIGACLRIYNIKNLMIFIGDQGWFYLSARDMILSGNIPLVGITASHTWLHQGPLWTYLLALGLLLFHFNPLAGAYITIFFDLLSVWLIFIVGKSLFSSKVAILTALLYATSPLLIIDSRMPYHTSLIPFFTILYLYALYKWIKGNLKYFPVIIFLLGILYNLELATSVLWFLLLLILGFGFWKKKKFTYEIGSTRVILFSIAGFIISMLPILLYDSTHGFPQTIKFTAWFIYYGLTFFGFPRIHPLIQPVSYSSFFTFALTSYQYLIFLSNSLIALFIFISSFAIFLGKLYLQLKNKTYHTGMILIGVTTILLFIILLINRTPSGAYLPMIFPGIIFITAVAIDMLFQRKQLFIPIVLCLLLISFLNCYTLLNKNYLMDNNGYGLTLAEREQAAKEIVREASGKEYNLIGAGKGSEFASFTMNYEYLTWWLGNGPNAKPSNMHFIISENASRITVKKEIVSIK